LVVDGVGFICRVSVGFVRGRFDFKPPRF